MAAEHMHAPDGQVGEAVAGANSPSAAALLPLCGEKGDGYHGSRYPTPLLNNSSSSAAPHLSLASTAPARRRSITVYTERVQNAQSTTKRFFFTLERKSPWSKCANSNLLGFFCDPQYVFFPGSLVQTLAKSQILQLRSDCIKSSVRGTGQLSALGQATLLKSVVSKM